MDSARETFIRFSQYAEVAMAKAKMETIQDEVALLSSLLLQDALEDQEIPPAEVEDFSNRIQTGLCGGKQPNPLDCKGVTRDLALIKGLYSGSVVGDEEVSRAAADLMSAVVLWLDENQGALRRP